MSRPPRVVTGGQTGADQAAWLAAERAGWPTGGVMPRGFQTEGGPRPEFAARFGAVESASDGPAVRTLANVRQADGTLVFAADPPGPGTLLTIDACRAEGKPHRVVRVGKDGVAEPPAAVARWIAEHRFETLNVAGDRESVAPGLADRVRAFLGEVFRLVASRL